MDYFIKILSYLMFSVGVVAIGWYVFNYVMLMKDVAVIKEEGMFVIKMTTMGAFVIVIANLIGAVLNGGIGIFWTYVGIGAIISILTVYLFSREVIYHFSNR